MIARHREKCSEGRTSSLQAATVEALHAGDAASAPETAAPLHPAVSANDRQVATGPRHHGAQHPAARRLARTIAGTTAALPGGHLPSEESTLAALHCAPHSCA